MNKIITSIPNLLLSILICFVLSSCSSTGVKMSDSSPWKTIQFEDQANACLLYTSPSPRDISGSRMPSSA